MKRILPLVLLFMSPAFAVEHATYDSAGRVTSLIDNGHRLELLGHFVLTADDGREYILQPHDQRSPIERTGELSWQGAPLDVPGVRFTMNITQVGNGISVKGTVRTAASRHVRSVAYVIALPRDAFIGGRIAPAGTELPIVKPEDPVFHRGSVDTLTIHDANGVQTVTVTTPGPREIQVVDTWNQLGRWYEVRIPLRTGSWRGDEELVVEAALSLEANPPVQTGTISVDTNRSTHRFEGFGANYCWVNTSPVIDYTLEHLRSTWHRYELKFAPWIAERDDPGPLLRRDFELMRRTQEAGIPWIISVWRLPEDFYEPRPGGGSPLGHGRKIATARWQDFLDGIGSFLLHVKQEYGAEPDLFSFNEPDLGVDIAFSAEEHRDAIRMIGGYFAEIGLKTKLLLGDTANPRERHRYVLPTAADPEALRYVGGLSFHSWMGASPEQYDAWGDVAEWLQLPLFIGEAGMDPGAYRNRTYDSYTYGLREMKDHFDFVRFARPQVSLYWQFTNDYGLVRTLPDGKIDPTGRFHLMRHLNNLTPPVSNAFATSSDLADVHALAFADGDTWTVHLLNVGSAARISLAGLSAGSWRVTTTTETTPFAETTWTSDNPLDLPARSMVTLTK